MSDVWGKMISDLNQLGEKVANKTGKYFQKAVDKGGELTQKGKIQVELERNKREFNRKLIEFGKYILEESNKGITDYTMDTKFQSFTEKLQNIKNHLQILEVEKKSIGVKNKSDLDIK